VEEDVHVSCRAWDEQVDRSYRFEAPRYETSGTACESASQNLHQKKADKNSEGVTIVKVTEVYDAARVPNAGKLIPTAQERRKRRNQTGFASVSQPGILACCPWPASLI